MIEDLLERGCEESITLFHGARNQEELYYANKFMEYEKEYKNFRYVPVLSDKEATNWDGEIGYLNDIAIKTYDNNFTGHKAYLRITSYNVCYTKLLRHHLVLFYIA